MHQLICPCSLLPFISSLCPFIGHNFCTVLAWISPEAGLVNVPTLMMLISVLVCFCRKRTPALAIHWPLAAVSSPCQAKWVLINSSWLLPSPCLLHWFTSFSFLLLSHTSPFQVTAPALCTHIYPTLSINPSSHSCNTFFKYYFVCMIIDFFFSAFPVP